MRHRRAIGVDSESGQARVPQQYDFSDIEPESCAHFFTWLHEYGKVAGTDGSASLRKQDLSNIEHEPWENRIAADRGWIL